MKVLDRLTKIDGIGGLGPQVFLEFDSDRLATQLDVRLGGQRWRNQHLLAGIVQSDELIEGKFYFVTVESDTVIVGIGLDNLGRRDILGTSSRSYHVGASRQQKRGKNQYYGDNFALHRCKSIKNM